MRLLHSLAVSTLTGAPSLAPAIPGWSRCVAPGRLPGDQSLTDKHQVPPGTAAVLKWLRTKEGQRRLARAIEDARETTERLEKARQPDPESLREPFTL